MPLAPASAKQGAVRISAANEGQTLRKQRLLKHALQQTCRDEDENAGASKRRDNAQPQPDTIRQDGRTEGHEPEGTCGYRLTT